MRSRFFSCLGIEESRPASTLSQPSGHAHLGQLHQLAYGVKPVHRDFTTAIPCHRNLTTRHFTLCHCLWALHAGRVVLMSDVHYLRYTAAGDGAPPSALQPPPSPCPPDETCASCQPAGACSGSSSGWAATAAAASAAAHASQAAGLKDVPLSLGSGPRRRRAVLADTPGGSESGLTVRPLPLGYSYALASNGRQTGASSRGDGSLTHGLPGAAVDGNIGTADLSSCAANDVRVGSLCSWFPNPSSMCFHAL